MTSLFRTWFSRGQKKSQRQRKTRTAQPRRRFVPALELLELRTLLAANGFLAGTVFLDANANHQFDPTESGVAGATVQLFQGSVTPPTNATPFATATTDAHGNYLFSNMAAGPYTLVALPTAGLANEAVQILSKLDSPVAVGNNAIQLTIPDPSSVYVNFNGTEAHEGVDLKLNGTPIQLVLRGPHPHLIDLQWPASR
jgi:hypothetical protein